MTPLLRLRPHVGGRLLQLLSRFSNGTQPPASARSPTWRGETPRAIAVRTQRSLHRLCLGGSDNGPGVAHPYACHPSQSIGEVPGSIAREVVSARCQSERGSAVHRWTPAGWKTHRAPFVCRIADVVGRRPITWGRRSAAATGKSGPCQGSTTRWLFTSFTPGADMTAQRARSASCSEWTRPLNSTVPP